ncbi:MAG: branched-chain amino acid ABC transporter permease [Pseudomonadota bacterium]
MRDFVKSLGLENSPREVLAALFFFLAIFLPWILEAFGEGFLITLASRICIYALAAMSLNLILGYGGMISFGHAAYFGVGAYVVGILAQHGFEGSTVLGITPPNSMAITLPLSMLIAGVTAAILGALCLRTAGAYFIMITLAFAQMLFFLFVSLEGYGGDDGIIMLGGRNTLGPVDTASDAQFYWLCLGLLLAFIFINHRLVRSRFGQVLQACRQNEPRLAALGCNVNHYKLTAFTIAGAVAGLAGGLLANHAEYVSPDYVHWTKSGDLMIMVILGGLGIALGPVVGAAAFLLLEEFLPVMFESMGLPLLKEHWRIVFGPLLICIVLFARGGLLGTLQGRFAPKMPDAMKPDGATP